MNNKFAVVGDLHLNYKTPMSRIDDYPNTCMAKLRSIRTSCKNEKINTVILLGDIFNSSKQSIQFLNQCIEVFYEFIKDGIQVYSIVGNHDISYEKIETLEKSPLQTLFSSGCIKHLKSLSLSENITIHGFDYPDEIIKQEKNTEKKLDICVAHRYYEYSLSDQCLKKEDLDFLDYQLYLFGHDHMPYQDIKNEKWILHRPGSMTRGTANQYNKERDCFFTVVSINKNLEIKFKKNPIDCLKPEFVFSERVLVNPSDDDIENTKNNSKIFEALIQEMDTSKTLDKSDVYNVLDGIACSDKCKNLLEKYFEVNGLFRREKKEDTQCSTHTN